MNDAAVGPPAVVLTSACVTVYHYRYRYLKSGTVYWQDCCMYRYAGAVISSGGCGINFLRTVEPERLKAWSVERAACSVQRAA